MKTYTLGTSESQVLEMVPDHSILQVHLDDNAVALVRMGEVFYAFQASCPHRGASLLEGSLSGEGEVVCPLHGYRFDIRTGAVKIGSCGNLEIYVTELTEKGLKIFI